MKFTFSIVLLLVCITISTSRPRKGNECRKNTSVAEEVRLALQWPAGVCYTSRRRCRSSIHRWTIHGAWPDSRNSSAAPAFCCGPAFDAVSVRQHVPELQDKWATLFPGTNDQFWKHEWDKHGTCVVSPKLTGLVQYFNQTVRLYDQLHLKDWLEESGIIPLHEKNGRTYETRLIHRALERHTNGKRIKLDCKRMGKSEDAVLIGLHVCYEPMSLEFADCGGKGDDKCGTHVRFIRPYSYVSKRVATFDKYILPDRFEEPVDPSAWVTGAHFPETQTREG